MKEWFNRNTNFRNVYHDDVVSTGTTSTWVCSRLEQASAMTLGWVTAVEGRIFLRTANDKVTHGLTEDLLLGLPRLGLFDEAS